MRYRPSDVSCPRHAPPTIFVLYSTNRRGILSRAARPDLTFSRAAGRVLIGSPWTDIMMSIRVSLKIILVLHPPSGVLSFFRLPGGRMGRESRRERGVCGLWSVVCVSLHLCVWSVVYGLWLRSPARWSALQYHQPVAHQQPTRSQPQQWRLARPLLGSSHLPTTG